MWCKGFDENNLKIFVCGLCDTMVGTGIVPKGSPPFPSPAYNQEFVKDYFYESGSSNKRANSIAKQ